MNLHLKTRSTPMSEKPISTPSTVAQVRRPIYLDERKW